MFHTKIAVRIRDEPIKITIHLLLKLFCDAKRKEIVKPT